MENADIITSDMKDTYIYLCTVFFEKWITYISLLMLGVFTNKLIETIIFMVFFFVLRRRTGGFHAKTFFQCYLTSVILMLIILLSNPFILQYKYLFVVLMLLSVIIILFIGCINHPDLAMSNEEFIISKLFARIIVCVEMFIIIVSYLFDKTNYIIYMILAIIICGFSMLLAKIFKQEIVQKTP